MTSRIHSIEYIRGLAMLGVIGIHTGAFSLTWPQADIHLFALLEIASRFSVPIFFFVSAFALFRQYPLDTPFNDARFLKRRFSRVLLPYLAWSVLYMFHYSATTSDWSIWFPTLVYRFFLFGMASYQLYFLVILLWFYLLMPLWRIWVRRILEKPWLCLGLLLVAQIVFNYYSSYILRPAFANRYLNLAVEFRMSWLPFHYLFLFLLGGVFAARYDRILTMLRQYRRQVSAIFFLSLGALLAHYYFLLFSRHYSLEQAVNTAHQLSPAGVLYSVAACFYLVMKFEDPLPGIVRKGLAATGRHSYTIFLVHPLFMHYFYQGLTAMGWVMTTPVTILFYSSTVLCSLGFATGADALMHRDSREPL